MKANKIYAILLCLVFALCISAPCLNDLLRVTSESEISTSENRKLAAKPVIRLDYLDPFPANYEHYFQDHFLLRQKLIKVHSAINIYLFNRSPVPEQVDIGKEKWLFNVQDDRKIYEGRIMLPDEKINDIVRLLHKRTLYLRERGIRFYVCFAPLSQEIYPEYLPNNYFRSPCGTQTDKIISAIVKDPVIQYIDLKSALLAAKQFGLLYQQTDNHWNQRGAFFAYRKIIGRMKKDFPVLKPLTYSDVAFQPIVKPGGTLASAIGMNNVFMETELQTTITNFKARKLPKVGYPPPYWFAYKSEYEIETAIPDQTMPRLFVVRDSFFNYTYPFFQQNFSKTIAIWDAWMYGANKLLIEKEKPDIVLLMIYEPHIPKILNVAPD